MYTQIIFLWIPFRRAQVKDRSKLKKQQLSDALLYAQFQRDRIEVRLSLVHCELLYCVCRLYSVSFILCVSLVLCELYTVCVACTLWALYCVCRLYSVSFILCVSFVLCELLYCVCRLYSVSFYTVCAVTAMWIYTEHTVLIFNCAIGYFKVISYLDQIYK